MTQLRAISLRSQAVLVVIGDAINFSSLMLLSMILARIISPEDMGTYRQILYLGPLIASLFEMGLSTSIYRFWRALDTDRRRDYGPMILAGLFVMGVLSSLTYVLLAVPLANAYDNPALKKAMLVSAFFPLSNIFPMAVRPILLSEGFSLRATSFELLLSLTAAAALVIPLRLGASFMLALTGWSVVLFCRIPLTLFAVHYYIPFRKPRWQPQLAREVWDYIWPIQVGRLPGWVLDYSDKVIASLLVAPQAFAIYSLGARELPFVSNVGGSISNVMIPRMVHEAQNNAWENICSICRSSCEKTAIVVYPFGAFSIIYAEPIMKFLFSAQYAKSAIPFRIYALLIFIRVLEYASIAKALGRTDLIMKASGLAALSVILSSVPFVLVIGINGMAWTTVLSTAVAMLFYLWNYRQLLGVPISSFFPAMHLLRIIILVFIAGYSGYVIQVSLGLSITADSTRALLVVLIRAAAISSIIYLLLLLVFERRLVFYFVQLGYHADAA